MDIREQLKQAKTPEEMKQYLLDLDSEFRFKCRRCGKCCKNQDTILFTPRDIFNIAKKLGAAPRQVIDLCAEVYIGRSSRIPLVHMVPVGPQRRCPLLLDDGRCRVHDCKPTVCALFPVGRVGVFDGIKDTDTKITRENISVRYILNDHDCGSAKRVNTIRGWLARFNIPEEDEFFIQWSLVTANLGAMIRKLEQRQCSEQTLNELWSHIYWMLYVDYDTKQDFMPQFEQAAEKLNMLCEMFRELSAGEADSNESTPETAGEEELHGAG